MIAADEDALICDFAETYHIYNYRSLPLSYAATLACGLREESRIRNKLTNQRASTNTLLLASAVDALNLLVWQRTKDGQKNRNRPESITQKLIVQDDSEKTMGFDSPAAFEAARMKIVNGR